MITGPLSARAQELTAQGAAFVTATVVRVEHPTSAKPGNVALVHEDGSMEGFVGGVCAQNSVRLYSLKAIERGEPLLLRILPDGPGLASVKNGANANSQAEDPVTGGRARRRLGHRPEPVPVGRRDRGVPRAVPAPAPDDRRRRHADRRRLLRLGPDLGLDAVDSRGGDSGAVVPSADDLALVVAAHGRDELAILRAALEAEVQYVGLVASRKRGAGVLDQLRGEGVPEELLARIDTPAGLDIGARTPAEVALSILASIIEVRRRESTAPRSWAAAPPTAVDPICGMTVVVSADALSAQHAGDTHYFCGEGCLRAFERQHALA